jgi:hypothetical protein
MAVQLAVGSVHNAVSQIIPALNPVEKKRIL